MSAMHVVVMGVSGCGKSEVGQTLAEAISLPLVEGDEYHPPANIEKMSRGVPLQDDDRAGWLARLGDELARREGGAVLTCSALKRAYRDVLRAACPGVRFLHLRLDEAEAQRRVGSRPGHFYPPALVSTQFAALEDPAGEPGVLQVDATLPVSQLALEAAAWLRGE
jgi:gluconokinase